MKSRLLDLVISFALLLMPIRIHAVTYECPAEQKLDNVNGYFSKEKLIKYKFSVRIQDEASGAKLSRCSFSSLAAQITCDNYDVDKVVQSLNGEIKKYYVFDSHFDVQLFSNLMFVENNGRGTIAFGTCKVVSP
jgi:hypothetical protein